MAIFTGIGIGTQNDPLQAAQEALRQAKSNLGAKKIDFALVFSSVEFAHLTVIKAISNQLGNIPVTGCSSLAIASNQEIFKKGLAVILFSLPQDISFSIACVKNLNTKNASLAGEELADKMLSAATHSPRRVSLILSDGLMRQSLEFLSGIQKTLGLSFPFTGGTASDNLAFKKTYLYSNSDVCSDSACGLLFGGRVNFGIGIKHGWKPIGKPRYVTQANDNIVYKIDGAPAYEIYREYFSGDIARLRAELKRISVFYPAGVYLAGEEECLLRNILEIRDDGSLVFQGNIPEGSMLRLMIGTKESCLAASSQAAEEMLRGMHGKTPDLVLAFVSVSRYILLGRHADKELAVIRERVGPHVPLIGLYTYGELAPLKAIDYHGKTYFHNQSIALLGLSSQI